MKRKFSWYLVKFMLVLLTCLQVSCRNAETKVKPGANENNTDTTAIDTKNSNRPTEDKLPGHDSPSTTTSTKPSTDDILANIDQYLVSASNVPAGANGISNASVTVTNTLSDITIQKAILEVSILLADGAEFRTDYYVLQNVEPGEKETIRIPNAARGSSVTSQIVKLKSLALTNGEMVLVGHRIVAK
jgi:hypothetical protein